tara:strand:- start:9 stop:215 length:207 start_codon:yes stop_codon:yes gene_type:complete
MAQSTQCYDCLHYTGEFKCKAFPVGIPRVIYIGQHDHTKEFKDDNGIRFESLKKFMEKKLTNSNKRLK